MLVRLPYLSHGFLSVEVAVDPVLSKYVQKPIKISLPFDRMSFRVPRITKMTENSQLKFQLSSDQKMWNLPWHTTFKYPQWVIPIWYKGCNFAWILTVDIISCCFLSIQCALFTILTTPMVVRYYTTYFTRVLNLS